MFDVLTLHAGVCVGIPEPSNIFHLVQETVFQKFQTISRLPRSGDHQRSSIPTSYFELRGLLFENVFEHPLIFEPYSLNIL